MSRWDSPLAIDVESNGLQWTVGPFPGLPAAMRFVSEHLGDTDRYRHHYRPLTAPDEAATRLHHSAGGLFHTPSRHQREPLEVDLRAAIACHHGDPGEDPHSDGLYAHLDLHRPWHLDLADPECWEHDCEHPRHPDGTCTIPTHHVVLCRHCTPTDTTSGGESAGDPYPECHVTWPCSPVLALCASFGITPPGTAQPHQESNP
ncbi:hypothetical protein EV191_1392 [Tamaricihabitans halophyticus]|uniref:Uncharacterized protein n=1 Tax=Tamaricihabitans halophyticus TaxID=1262583 RepID=A0A4R2PSB6_9PSEU|nr:hypothetical protein [Tamaricihabitans halophyticus]TCP38760.1 hypothetical protein EV191_1392 [Tamaricihabitans halophyticus]